MGSLLPMPRAGTGFAEPMAGPAGSADGEPEAYFLEEQVGFLLRLANQRHVAIFQSQAPCGLTPTQFAALVKIAEIGECSQNELGRRTKMDVATAKGVVDRIFEKGLVEFTEDPNDRRRKLIVLSRAGKAAIPELYRQGHGITRSTLEPLSDGEREVFLELVAKLT